MFWGYVRYFLWVTKHRWYVFCLCVKNGIWLQGLLHDFSKFYPDEFIPSAIYFHKRLNPDGTPNEKIFEDYKRARRIHKVRNPHHWEHWVDWKTDNGGVIGIRKMEDKYFKEMICDWVGCSKSKFGKEAVRRGDNLYETRKWFHFNKYRMLFHNDTLARIQLVLYPINYQKTNVPRTIKNKES